MRIRPISLALAAAACAAVREPPGPPPFQGVKTVALVRWREADAPRRKDPLDALKESLDAREYATRVVEVGRRVPDALRPVRRLHERVEGKLRSGWARAGRSDRVERLGTEAVEAARALGVDAVVLYHREEDWRLPALPEPRPFRPPGLRSALPAPGPVGALTLVDAHGAARSFAWGSPGDPLDPDPATPLNAVEAIEGLLRALSGAPDDDADRRR